MVLLPASHLAAWLGIDDDPHRLSTNPTDYERARAIQGYVGSLPVGDSQAIILTEVTDAAWWPTALNRGVIVGVQYVDSDEDILDLIRTSDTAQFEPQSPELSIEEGGAWLFDATYAGSDLMGKNADPISRTRQANALHLNLPAGKYAISTLAFDTASMSGVLHSLTPSKRISFTLREVLVVIVVLAGVLRLWP